ncbi:response regulator transcription factor [Actinophytocola sp.]|uniref:response regulator transcription factor n=1 Tax=Actinophytocola sp. TaxID=1872138 RepID=UPI002ED652FC
MTGIVVGVIDRHPLYLGALARLVVETPGLELCAATASVARFLSERRCANCVVLLDSGLPWLPGASAVRTVTGHGHRVLVLSAETARQEVRAAMSAGAVGYLGKSAEAEEIVAAVRQVAAGNRYLPPSVLLDGPSPQLDLSDREVDVLTRLAGGARDEDIARSLKISVRTVRSYLDRIRDKTGLRRRSELTRYAIEHGLVAFRVSA